MSTAGAVKEDRVVSAPGLIGEMKVVEIMRSGSGGCVVNRPGPEWLSAVEMTDTREPDWAYEPYTHFRVAFMPESKGYGDMPGCSIVILPGTHEAKGRNRNEVVPLKGVPRTDRLFHVPIAPSGMFSLSTNFNDLKSLHAALGGVIESIEKAVAEDKAGK